MPRPVRSAMERSLSREMLYGRAAELRVFVSSKMRDGSLHDERQTAIRVINKHPWHKAWAWEISAHAGPYSARALCVGYAETSDFLLLLLGDDITPITRSEYLAAKRAEVPRIILIKDGVAASPDLSRFVARERAKVVTANFRNLPELRTQIRHALKDYGVFGHRVSVLRQRTPLR